MALIVRVMQTISPDSWRFPFNTDDCQLMVWRGISTHTGWSAVGCGSAVCSGAACSVYLHRFDVRLSYTKSWHTFNLWLLSDRRYRWFLVHGNAHPRDLPTIERKQGRGWRGMLLGFGADLAFDKQLSTWDGVVNANVILYVELPEDKRDSV